MATVMNPYLSFQDNAREAMEFYQSVFGGKLDVRTFKDFGVPVAPDEENLVMHSALTADNGITLMASDAPAQMGPTPSANGRISLSGDNDGELRSYFNKLAEGGSITTPLETSQWGDTFGMLTDKFGVSWLVDISGQNTASEQ